MRTVLCIARSTLPALAGTQPPPGPGAVPPGYARSDVSPGLAMFLGFIPGVGASYNAQSAKGLVHAVIFGVIISILNSGSETLQIVFGIFLPVWVFYMAFEAYHTARKRALGEPVDEYSSIIKLGGQPDNAPVAGIVLVVLGIVLLLHTLHVFDLEYLARYWPVLLIAAGVYGLGDATLNGREKAVVTYLEEHCIPALLGRDPARIEDIWHYFYRGPRLLLATDTPLRRLALETPPSSLPESNDEEPFVRSAVAAGDHWRSVSLAQSASGDAGI